MIGGLFTFLGEEVLIWVVGFFIVIWAISCIILVSFRYRDKDEKKLQVVDVDSQILRYAQPWLDRLAHLGFGFPEITHQDYPGGGKLEVIMFRAIHSEMKSISE
jgi:hypothetical protein